MSTSDDGYKGLFLAAMHHLRCVSGSRNSFDWSRFAPEKMPPRLPEVERMHAEAAKFVSEHDDDDGSAHSGAGIVGADEVLAAFYRAALSRAAGVLRAIHQSSGQSWIRRSSREGLQDAESALRENDRGPADAHAVIVSDREDGFAPAAIATTTYGVRYLLEGLRKMEPEAPDMGLHQALLGQLESACAVDAGQQQARAANAG